MNRDYQSRELATTPPRRDYAREQAELVAQCRRESNLDHMIPLPAFVSTARPEYGLSPKEYYTMKAARAEPGRFDPLYKLACTTAWQR